MKADQVILTRQLPKTGQETEYQADDDGTYQAGWWKGLKIADNKTRFIVKTLNGDDVVIDLATGLMWAADGDVAGCGEGIARDWGNTLIYIESLDFAGFIDWRLPNVKELFSIIDFSLFNPAIKEPPFSNTYSEEYWSSTMYPNAGAMAWRVHFRSGAVSIAPVSIVYYLRCVRGGL